MSSQKLLNKDDEEGKDHVKISESKETKSQQDKDEEVNLKVKFADVKDKSKLSVANSQELKRNKDYDREYTKNLLAKQDPEVLDKYFTRE